MEKVSKQEPPATTDALQLYLNLHAVMANLRSAGADRLCTRFLRPRAGTHLATHTLSKRRDMY